MHESPPTGIPSQLVAGDSWTWVRSVSGHLPSEGWGLRYLLRRMSADEETPTSIAAGTDPDADRFLVQVPTATTDDLAAGRYRWAEQVHRNDDVFTIETGRTQLVAPGQPGKAERMVAILEDAIEKLVLGKNKVMNVNGRSVTRNELGELRQELTYWRSVLDQEENPHQLGPQIAARMQVPGFSGHPRGFR